MKKYKILIFLLIGLFVVSCKPMIIYVECQNQNTKIEYPNLNMPETIKEPFYYLTPSLKGNITHITLDSLLIKQND